MRIENRLNILDFPKMCLMLIVVAAHSIEVANDDWFHLGIQSIHALKLLSAWFSSFHVQTFTMISGYLYYYLRFEKGKYSSFRSLIISKAKRLLVPCVFVSLIWIIPINTLLFHMNWNSVIHSFILLENPSQLWFLVMLFGVFIVARLADNVADRRAGLWIILILGAYLVGVVGSRILLNVFQIWKILQYLSFFYLGFYLRKFARSFDSTKLWWLFLFIDLLAFSAYQFLLPQGNGYLLSGIRVLMEFVTNVAGCLMAFSCFSAIGRKTHTGEGISFLITHSMVIYLIHNQFNFIIVHLTHKYLHTGMIVFVSYLGTMLLSVLVSSLLLRFRWTRMLVGEK